MTTLARPSSNCKRQIHHLVREDVTTYIRTITASVQLENKITGHEPQVAQDELIGRKPSVTVTLTLKAIIQPSFVRESSFVSSE
jgi:hypothetical protein